MQVDQGARQAREVLDVADPALGERDPQQLPGTATLQGGGGDGVQRGQQPHQQTEEEDDGLRVQRADGPGLQCQAHRDLGVTGVRAGAGDQRAQHHGGGTDDHEGPRQQPQRRGQQRSAGPVGLVEPEQQGGGHRDERGRDEEVGGHRGGVQAGEDGDAAQDGLGRGTGQDHQAVARQPTSVPQQEDHDGDRGDGDDPGQHAVAELDGRVQAELLLHGRGVGPGHALRPGRAAQARRGQAHQTAGDDDAHLHDEVDDDSDAHDHGEPGGGCGHGPRIGRCRRRTRRGVAASVASCPGPAQGSRVPRTRLTPECAGSSSRGSADTSTTA